MGLFKLGTRPNIACLRSTLYCAMVVSFSPIWVVWVGVTTILTVGGWDGRMLTLQQKRLGTTKNADITKAIEYCLKRWQALTRYLDDGNLPIDNNWAENQMRPWALGRKNWLFAGSLESGQRAASIMSLIQSARLNGLDPYAYLADVLRRLPTHPDSQIDELLPHIWKPPQ